MNYWIVLIPLLHLEPIKGQIYITGHTFLKHPLWGSSMCCLCTMANLSSCKKQNKTWDLQKTHCTASFCVVVVINEFHHISAVVWKCMDPLHMSTFVFSLIFIKTGGYMGGKIPPLLAEEGHGEEAEKGLIIWSALSGRNYWSRWLSHRLWGTSTVWFCDFWAVTHRSSVHAKGSELLSNLLSSCQIRLETAGD